MDTNHSLIFGRFLHAGEAFGQAAVLLSKVDTLEQEEEQWRNDWANLNWQKASGGFKMLL